LRWQKQDFVALRDPWVLYTRRRPPQKGDGGALLIHERMRSLKAGDLSDCLIMEGLSEHPSNEGGTVYLTLHGVAADPPLLTGADVGGKAEAGGVALGHGSVSVALVL
jgi:hypothetical protein